ncbi:hypothetical protein [Commensalibacter oyaizuii]|uniref:Uncharacterized protein n=1 Tax=Commensalibacter oyaizuii TaxID=3043873 RepID=A0ABT6Q0X2_9PROT|nr:hypothetical protein [Commensalibacter sp. TBRC 16381]MDI2090729.1 hypothetical protein [Commensalibacter sp. TBRC 16381]
MHKTGNVLSPTYYKNWQAEWIGDPTDSDGIHIILHNIAHSQQVIFWNIAIEAIEQTLRKQNIVILWEDKKTLSYLLCKDYLSKKMAKAIIHNFYEKTHSKIVFNLTQLGFDFDFSLVILSFIYAEKDCPEIRFSFEQLEMLLSKYIKQ